MGDNVLTLSEWVRVSMPGSHYIYATTRHLTDNWMTRKIGIEAWKHALDGSIYLVQKRVVLSTPSMFEYIAIKASRPPRRELVARDYGDPIERAPFKVTEKNASVQYSEVV